jgi:ribosomal protein S18 acetylase RimI-like enzyme
VRARWSNRQHPSARQSDREFFDGDPAIGGDAAVGAPAVTPVGPELTIRRATRADLDVIGTLGALLVRAHHDFDPRRFIPATPNTAAGYASFLGTQLDEPRVIILVAERAGKVVGYAYCGAEGTDYMSLRGPAGVLYDIVVAPEQRGHGVGRALLEAALGALTARGVPRVVLSTAERNAVAQHLFAAAGFRRTMIEMTRELGGDEP